MKRNAVLQRSDVVGDEFGSGMAGISSSIDGHPQVLLAYEDKAMGFQGMHVWRVIAKEVCGDLGGEVETEPDQEMISVWNFQYFQTPELRSAAAQQAQAAPIVILALRNLAQLRGKTREWLELWSRQRNIHPGALVVVTQSSPGPEGGDGPLYAELRTLAIRTGREFFYCSTDGAEPHQGNLLELRPDSFTSPLSSPNSMLNRQTTDPIAHHRSGLNE